MPARRLSLAGGPRSPSRREPRLRFQPRCPRAAARLGPPSCRRRVQTRTRVDSPGRKLPYPGAAPAPPCARRAGDRLQVEVVRGQLPVGTGRRSVEEQREPIRRPDLTKDNGRVQGVVDAEPADLHTLAREELADELAMAIVANFTDDAGAHLQSSEAGADVAGEAAHIADEVSLLAQRGSDLRWIQVGAEPAHHDHLDAACRGPGAKAHVFFQSISHSWSGSVVNSHSRTSPAIAFR